MRTERNRGPADAGFTLIEVLVAMVILGIGLMAVEALGIMAARSVALAQKNSEYTVSASHHLESALDSVMSGTLTACGAEWADGASVPGATVTRTGTKVGSLGTLTVTVKPTGPSLAAPPVYELSQQVFLAPGTSFPPC